MTAVQTINIHADNRQNANASQNLKRCFANALAEPKTPHLIWPNRTQSPPTTRHSDSE
jgi:hypothetical protein